MLFYGFSNEAESVLYHRKRIQTHLKLFETYLKLILPTYPCLSAQRSDAAKQLLRNYPGVFLGKKDTDSGYPVSQS